MNNAPAFVAFLLAFFLLIIAVSLSEKVDELILEVEHWRQVAGCDVTVEDLVLNAFICVKNNKNIVNGIKNTY
jgi:hypothetical protein